MGNAVTYHFNPSLQEGYVSDRRVIIPKPVAYHQCSKAMGKVGSLLPITMIPDMRIAVYGSV
jgi:hypothetical protein